MLSEKFGIISLLGPTADYNGTALVSDAFSMANYDEATILVSHKGGTTGLSALTVYNSTDAAQSGAAAIPFAYRRKTTGASAVWGDISYATSAGISTVATEDTIIEIFVRSSELADGKKFVHLQAAETVNDPVTGSIIAILGAPRFGGVSQPNCLA